MLAIAENTSLIYFDIKLLDTVEHKRYTGAGNETILTNLEALCMSRRHAEKVVVRVPCIPGINDGKGQIKQIAALVRGCGISKMELMPYNGMAAEKYKWIDMPYSLQGLVAREKQYYAVLDEIINKTGIEAIGEH